MKAEQNLPQEDKIKYVLNGETRYYTESELREYYKNLLINNKVYLPNSFERRFERLINTLDNYNGDPYGDVPVMSRKYYHDLESMGALMVIP